MSSIESPSASTRPRLRRWAVGGLVVLMLLAGYAAVLHQLSEQVGAGIEASLRVAPTVEDHHHRAE
ncbi:hypothetical protein E5843_02585 [Luteimonas yindakuii]|uniref:hypothetical protein n=1 Tax=Luteimonas yindakuii TaxID=2565782 RepID=UPI0010A3F7FA|nr:hypothetical protein [Luteimonas yindakuii]QCO66944.1 hypothetical protein E5843_02585 [Luteimonas yindakuii]